MVSRGQTRGRPPVGALTCVSPDRESGRPASGRKRPVNGSYGQCAGYCRGMRCCTIPFHRFSVGQSLWQALGRHDAAVNRGNGPGLAGTRLDAPHDDTNAVSLG